MSEGITRRGFLRAATGAGAALALGGTLGACGARPEPGNLQGLLDLELGDAHFAWDLDRNLYRIYPEEHAVAALGADFSEKWRYGGLGSGEGQLNFPTHLVAGRDGALYIIDRGNARIVQVNADGAHVRTLTGGVPDVRSGAVASDGTLWVAAPNQHRVQSYDRDGNLSVAFGDHGTGAGQLNGPRALAIDGDGHLHVVDTGNALVQVFDATGQWLRGYGVRGDQDGGLLYPRSIAIDSLGITYVSDPAMDVVQAFRPTGAPLFRFRELKVGAANAVPLEVSISSGGLLYVRVRTWT